MISSMTGFGTAEGTLGAARVTAEVRSVNHRFFTPTVKLPAALARWEGDVREALRRRFARGHVTATVRIERADPAAGAVNEERLASYARALRAVVKANHLDGGVELSALLRLPGVLADAEPELALENAEPLVRIIDEAASRAAEMRAAEGRHLVQVLRERIGAIEQALAAIGARAPQRIVEQRDRLIAAVGELAGTVALDPQRMAQEIAILADRLDVSEETDRFRAHVAAFRATLDNPGGEPVGKRLGFILQEMLREANTTGSKANDAAMLADVVRVKEELERIREQVENLE